MLMANSVPSAWQQIWDGPLTPSCYLRIFSKKANSLY